MVELKTDEDVWGLVRALEACTVEGSEFHHREHVAVAMAYLVMAAGVVERAMDPLRRALQAFSRHVGKPDRYHETMTWFWLERVREVWREGATLVENVDQAIERLGDAGLVRRYYSEEVLKSEEARRGVVEPDLGAATGVAPA